MTDGKNGKITIPLIDAVAVVKRIALPAYVKVISEQNRAIREARRR